MITDILRVNMRKLFPGQSMVNLYEKMASLWGRAIKKMDLTCKGKSTKRALEIISDLSCLSEEMVSVCRNSEPVFIKFGQGLQSVHSDVMDFTHLLSGTIQSMGGISEYEVTDSNVLANIGGLATESLSGLKKCQTQISNNLNHINEMIIDLIKLQDLIDIIKGIAKILKVIGFNIQVESARSLEFGDFSIISREIKQFSEKVASIAEIIYQDSKNSASDHISVHDEISIGLDHLDKLADDAERDVHNAIAEIERYVNLSLKSLERADIHSREISRQIGEIVIGIQIHDSMNQRIEHIVKAFQDVEDMFSGENSDKADMDHIEKKLSFAWNVLEIQKKQLRDVISEVEAVYGKNKKAFDGINLQISEFLSSLSNLEGGYEGSSFAEEHDSLTALKLSLYHFKDLIKNGMGLVSRIDKTASHAAQTADSLLNHVKTVHKISQDTKLIALNAIIKATSLGDRGKTFDVLAQELKKISDQANMFVEDVENISKSISSRTGNLNAGSLEYENSLSVNLGCHDSLDESIIMISTGYEKFMENSRKASGMAAELKKSISRERDALGFIPLLAQELRQAGKRLEKVTDSLETWSYMDSESVSAKSKLLERYTMSKEREIHDQIITQTYTSPEIFFETEEDHNDTYDEKISASEISVIKHGEHDLDDNVELF